MLEIVYSKVYRITTDGIDLPVIWSYIVETNLLDRGKSL